MRIAITLVTLLGLIFLTGCSKTYHAQTDAKVPEEMAAAIKGKTFHAGRNELVDFKTHKLSGVIKNGKLVSMALEIDGRKPQSVDFVARMAVADPAPPWPGGEVGQSCSQKLDLCNAGCHGDRCCLLECWFNYEVCSMPPGGSDSIRMF